MKYLITLMFILCTGFLAGCSYMPVDIELPSTGICQERPAQPIDKDDF